MKLVDYVLWAPELPKDDRVRFSHHTRSTCDLFSRLCGKLTTADTRRVLINCVESACKEAAPPFPGVAEAELVVPDDLAAFPTRPAIDQKKRVLELLMQGLELVAASKGWDMAPFLAAREKVVERRFENRWTLKKKSIQLGLTGFLDCTWEVDAFEAFLSIRDRKGVTLAVRQALKKPPHEFQFARFVSKLAWSKGSLQLLAKDGTVVSALEADGANRS